MECIGVGIAWEAGATMLPYMDVTDNRQGRGESTLPLGHDHARTIVCPQPEWRPIQDALRRIRT